MHITRTFGHLLGGSLLVAGTSIGVGMLAAPVATAEGGLLPSLFIYLLCWIFSLCTGLLILEATIWMPKDANLVTLADRLLGKSGKIVCWILYLFLFGTLMVAHIAGGGSIVNQITHDTLPTWAGMLLYTALFAPVVYLGTHSVDRLNLVLVSGIAITYLLFVIFSVPHIQLPLLKHANWGKAWLALPLLFTAFGYQNLIPTLMTYMNRNVQKVRLAIVIGTVIPFIIYTIWEILILGIVPLKGAGGLREALINGESAIGPLYQFIHNPAILNLGKAFAFFVLTASFIGMSIGFFDFLADGLKIEKKGKGRLKLCAIMFIIPMIISLINPNIFIAAISHAGGLGVALLLGLMPIAFVWKGRYYRGYSLMHQQLPGGKIFLSALTLFVLIELFIELRGFF